MGTANTKTKTMKNQKTFELGDGTIVTSMKERVFKNAVTSALIKALKEDASLEAYCSICNALFGVLRIPAMACYIEEGECLVWRLETTRLRVRIEVNRELTEKVIDTIADAIEMGRGEDNLRREVRAILIEEIPILELLLRSESEDYCVKPEPWSSL